MPESPTINENNTTIWDDKLILAHILGDFPSKYQGIKMMIQVHHDRVFDQPISLSFPTFAEYAESDWKATLRPERQGTINKIDRLTVLAKEGNEAIEARQLDVLEQVLALYTEFRNGLPLIYFPERP